MTLRQRNLAIALGVLAVIGLAVWLGLSATSGWRTRTNEGATEVAERRVERRNQLCASTATYERLKTLMFEEAAQLRAAGPADFDLLAANAVVRMENPVVTSGDQDLGETLCEGRFVLELPPGSERGFGGQRRLAADIAYGVQAAADGSGLVYRLDGAEAIIARVAAFGLAGRPPAPGSLPVEVAQAPVASDSPQVLEAPREVAQQVPPPAPRPPAAQTPATRAPAERAPAARPPAERPRAAAPVAVASARPSFPCRYARSRSERLVCASPSLAAADRSMASLYVDAVADGDPDTRRALRATRDRFLAIRDRCDSEACVARVYRGRVAEIEDIASGDY